MNIIIIDDDLYKTNCFKNCLTEEDNLSSFTNFRDGMIELVDNSKKYDLLVLDLSFPFYEDSQIETNLGLGVLRELRRKKLEIPTVIYSSNNADISTYPNVIDYIHYDSSVYFKDKVTTIKQKVLKK